MQKSSIAKRKKKSVKVKNLTAKVRSLTPKESKKVKGGLVGDIHQPIVDATGKIYDINISEVLTSKKPPPIK